MREVIEKTRGWDDAWQREDFDRRFDEYVVLLIEREGRPAGGMVLEWASARNLYERSRFEVTEFDHRSFECATVAAVRPFHRRA